VAWTTKQHLDWLKTEQKTMVMYDKKTCSESIPLYTKPQPRSSNEYEQKIVADLVDEAFEPQPLKRLSEDEVKEINRVVNDDYEILFENREYHVARLIQDALEEKNR